MDIDRETILNTLKLEGVKSSFSEVFESGRSTLLFVTASVLFWIVFTLLGSPVYSYQLISANPALFTEAMNTLLVNQINTGILNVVFPVITSFLVAAVLVVTGKSLLLNYQASGSVSGSFGGVIGFAGAGCASCGAGVIALLGVAGGASVLPFKGLGVQFLSIVILLGSLEYTGRQEKVCAVE